MDGVPAWQHRCRPHAVKQVLKAHRAVLAHAVLHADVVALRNTESCLATVHTVTAVLHSHLSRLHWDPCSFPKVSAQKAETYRRTTAFAKHIQRALPSLKSSRCTVSGHGASD